MAAEQVHVDALAGKLPQIRDDLIQALKFAETDANQMAELAEAILAPHRLTDENLKALGTAFASRLFKSALLVMDAIHGKGQGQEVASNV
ncbi:hypothetical protein [Solidesulfovibrio magneticus]|uniref:Uncharacterized protein n=1 Tax=Solidesulfovibrio magneticus (strain ATCC 700980 / DSM 13731 / RS-1) TaxID=573370 RepID=C4XUL1_SOLM1|nr:hypothetical protein [Solidesulfovibrio magneticus]BAH73462.1 hypothetical protein DMR_p1_00460 [Solidesulfovibrio magneticus RS-1]